MVSGNLHLIKILHWSKFCRYCAFLLDTFSFQLPFLHWASPFFFVFYSLLRIFVAFFAFFFFTCFYSFLWESKMCTWHALIFHQSCTYDFLRVIFFQYSKRLETIIASHEQEWIWLSISIKIETKIMIEESL